MPAETISKSMFAFPFASSEVAFTHTERIKSVNQQKGSVV